MKIYLPPAGKTISYAEKHSSQSPRFVLILKNKSRRSNPHNFGEHFLWIFLRQIVNKFWLENSKTNLRLQFDNILIKKEYFTTTNLSLQVYLWKNKGLKIWNISIINSVYTKKEKKIALPILQLKPTQTFFNLILCVFFNLKDASQYLIN